MGSLANKFPMVNWISYQKNLAQFSQNVVLELMRKLRCLLLTVLNTLLLYLAPLELGVVSLL